MTEIAIRSDQAALVPDQATPAIDLRAWAEQATAAAIYAERVCSTSMAPAAYRGKPAEACAAILAGAELGFNPMASLRAFDNISGTPAPKAMTLRAVVQAAGHEVVIEESSNQRAVVSGRRKGADTWQTSVWDLARAQQLAQFKSNPNYRTNLAQMLVARATAEVCRWIAADAIMGMPYAAEEIQDQPALAPSPVPARRLTMADLDEPAAAIEAAEPAAMMTDKQRKTMFALWGDLGIGDDRRDFRLRKTAEWIGVDSLESTNELTEAEADRVIAALRERKEQQGGAQ